jgi:alpha-glucosidase
MQPLIQSTSEIPKGPLQLRVYTGDDCRDSLYQDDGHTFAYQRGIFLRVTYTCQTGPNSVTVTSATDKNGFQPWWNSAEVTLFGVPSKPKEFRINDQPSREWHYDSHSQTVTVTVPDAIKPWTIKAAF